MNARELRRLIAAYANGKTGPFGSQRLELYHQVRDLFEELRNRVPLPRLKPYELKDSFLGGDEADLILLTCSHERRSQESIAQDVLRCSTNAVGTRRAGIAQGTRIAGMCIQAEFGYRGDFQSSAHPIALPLNLSEVYVLLRALKEYEAGREQADPHAAISRRVANMAYTELSDYAKEKLTPRFDDAGYRFEHVDPVFEEDSSLSSHWIYFEKAQVPVRVTLTSGEELLGRIVPTACHDGRPSITVRTEDGDTRSAAWADVCAIERA